MSDQPSFYIVDNERYPRVTAVLDRRSKPWIDAWRMRIGDEEANKISNHSRHIGTLVHQTIDEVHAGRYKDKDWRIPVEIQDIILNYIEWFKTNVKEVIHSEQTVVSRKYRYGGTIDALLLMYGESLPVLTDYKTSKSPSPEWPLQLSAYKQATEETLGIEIGKRQIVQLKKTPPYKIKVYEYPDHGTDFERWLNALQAWRDWETDQFEMALVEHWENSTGPYEPREPTEEELEEILTSLGVS